MKCKLCNDREMAHGAEQGTGLCNFCWELKSRMEAEPDLARRILATVVVERNERSPLGPLRDEIVGYVGKLQAQEASEEGEEVLAWAEVLVDGVRGLSDYDDVELLQEFEGLMDVDDEGRALAARLSDFAVWKQVLEDSKERIDGLEDKA